MKLPISNGGINLELEGLKTIYKCPVCKNQLIKKEKRYVCENNHSFDIAEKRYVNLLLANQKKTNDPGDSNEMMESRKNFLNKGYYSELSELINELVAFYLDGNSEYILDAGCGEGYFLSKLKNKLNLEVRREKLNYYGVDISKSAVRSASKRDREIFFTVGSNFNLPILNNSIDILIRNFAPSENEELNRVLKDSGKLVVVTPGTYHLFELKSKLYEIPRTHEIKEASFEGFKIIEHKELKYNIELNDKEDIRNLISMTPYYWSITSEMRNEISNISYLKTTLHFNIDVYGKI